MVSSMLVWKYLQLIRETSILFGFLFAQKVLGINYEEKKSLSVAVGWEF